MIVGLWLGGNPLGLGCSRIPSGLDLDGIGDRPSERLRLDVGLRDIVFKSRFDLRLQNKLQDIIIY